jgi:hypothetical protein
MKRTALTFALLLLLAAGVAAAEEPATATPPVDDGTAALTPVPPAAPEAPREAEPSDPLFVDDGDLLCVSFGTTSCSVSYSCSTQVACASTGTPVRIRHCRCCDCGPLGCDIGSCTTTSFPTGCC